MLSAQFFENIAHNEKVSCETVTFLATISNETRFLISVYFFSKNNASG
jgi:hypothetical protein